MASRTADRILGNSRARPVMAVLCCCALGLSLTLGCQSKSESKHEPRAEAKPTPTAPTAKASTTTVQPTSPQSELPAKVAAAPRKVAAEAMPRTSTSRGGNTVMRFHKMTAEPESRAMEDAPAPALAEKPGPALSSESTAATEGPETAAHAPDVSVPTPEQRKTPVAGKGPGKIVKLFYATDRQPVDVPLTTGMTADGWYRLTVLTAACSILMAFGAYRWPHRRWWTTLSAGGLLITAAMGGMTIYARNLPETAHTDLRRYGNQRGELELGTCEVSIPEGHAAGEVERPSLLRFEFSENPLKHVVLVTVRQQDSDTFYGQLQQHVGGSQRKEAIVFIHGYNVSFDVAARRLAQITHDLRFDGAPILYSWPSQGGLLGYTIDENNVQWTVPHLKDFLVDVARRSGADAIHLVGHSMGNRALTTALRDLFFQLDAKCPKFNEVVLTAPDIDADVFRQEIAPAIVKVAQRVTLYASSNDEALVLSKKVHGYARAGDSGDELVVVPGMDTIDVSAVDTSLLGHSYYGDNRTVLADLYDLLRESKPPEQRRSLRPVRLGMLQYWVFSR